MRKTEKETYNSLPKKVSVSHVHTNYLWPRKCTCMSCYLGPCYCFSKLDPCTMKLVLTDHANLPCMGNGFGLYSTICKSPVVA